MQKSTHFPAIDGLRGAIALSVLTAHVNMDWLPHVYIVMDMFLPYLPF